MDSFSVKELIAEIKTSMKSYDEAGLIDEISLRRYVRNEIKRFGNNILCKQDAVLEVCNGHAQLPDNFDNLNLAVKCSPCGYNTKSEDILQQSHFWTERIEKKSTWNSCDPCCVEEGENRIVERFYFNNAECEFYYDNPVLLNLTNTVISKVCSTDCVNVRNLITRDCPYDMTIKGKDAYFNFDHGSVYIIYYGVEVEEDGDMIIPDDSHSRIQTYLEYYLKKRIIEDLSLNGDDPKILNLLSYYAQEARNQFSLALTASKFDAISKSTWRKIKNKARRNTLQYECMFPYL